MYKIQNQNYFYFYNYELAWHYCPTGEIGHFKDILFY